MKEKIVETALANFLANGIRNITMQKLAHVLGVSTKTMYKYFNDKDQLLEECLKLHYKGADKLILEILNKSANVVSGILDVYAKAVATDFGINQLFYQDLNHYYPALQDHAIKEHSGALKILKEAIEQGINEGYFLPDLDASVALETLTILYISVTRNESYREFELKSVLLKHTINIYIRGICTGEGLKLIGETNKQTVLV